MVLVVGVPDERVVEVGEEFIVGYRPPDLLSLQWKHGRRPVAKNLCSPVFRFSLRMIKNPTTARHIPAIIDTTAPTMVAMFCVMSSDDSVGTPNPSSIRIATLPNCKQWQDVWEELVAITLQFASDQVRVTKSHHMQLGFDTPSL